MLNISQRNKQLKINKMEKTSIKLIAVSLEEMLNNNLDNQYNKSLWTEKVKRFSTFKKIQFYLVPKDECFTYNRFYVSYITEDEIYIFSKWSAFSSSITNNGFCKVIIKDGEVFKTLFKDKSGKEGYAENCKENRLDFKKRLTPLGIMISNCI